MRVSSCVHDQLKFNIGRWTLARRLCTSVRHRRQMSMYGVLNRVGPRICNRNRRTSEACSISPSQRTGLHLSRCRIEFPMFVNLKAEDAVRKGLTSVPVQDAIAMATPSEEG